MLPAGTGPAAEDATAQDAAPHAAASDRTRGDRDRSPAEGRAAARSTDRAGDGNRSGATGRTRSADRAGSSAANRSRRTPGRGLVRQQQAQSREVAAAAGNAVVTAARVGRLLGRTGWRLARQLPGMSTVEQQAQRLRAAAETEFGRLLDMPQTVFGGATSPEEQRALLLVQDAGADGEPLRTAMNELLERSTSNDAAAGQDYLFGTIVSQLVPDEARILAALAGGHTFAALDVVARHGRSSSRTQLSNASTVGAAAGVALTANTGTYLTRLAGFGLIRFGEPDSDLDDQFARLDRDPSVRAARDQLDKARTVRKSVTLSPFGRQFWAACAPSRAALGGADEGRRAGGRRRQ